MDAWLSYASAVRNSPVGRLSSLLERIRREFLDATDPTFIHHAKYTKELPKKNGTGSVYKRLHVIGKGRARRWEAIFTTDSATIPGVSYKQRVELTALEGLLRDKKSDLTFKEKVMYALNNGDLQINCSCPAHLFWGYKYINTSLGTAAVGAEENRAPNIRNPQRRGLICKHADLCLHVLPFNASSIASAVKEALAGDNKSGGLRIFRDKKKAEGMARLASVLY